MVPEICVTVDSWFSAGVVVSFVDQYGVEYRGALLKRTDETPEFKPSFCGLASPVSVLHDHPYSKLVRKAWRKQVPAKVLCNYATHFQLTPQDIVCRRNSLGTNTYQRRAAVIETDFVVQGNNFRGDRSAKYLARLRINDSLDKRSRTIVPRKPKKNKTQRQPLNKALKKPPKRASGGLGSPTESSSLSSTPMSSPLGRLDISPSSLIAHTQNCSVGLTPANTAGVYSPLRVSSSQAEYSEDSVSSSAGLSSRSSSVSPIFNQVVRPFSIALQRVVAPTQLPHSSATISLE